jgi:hypothetical protein
MHVLHLDRATAGQLVVQMLSSTAKRLSRSLCFGPQAVAKRTGRAGQQTLVKLVAVRGNTGEQI